MLVFSVNKYTQHHIDWSCVMEIGNDDHHKHPNPIEYRKFFYTIPAEDRTRALRDWDSMNTGVQVNCSQILHVKSFRQIKAACMQCIVKLWCSSVATAARR